MEHVRIAKLAVSAAPYAIDKPYDYAVPGPLADQIQAGVRVTVPFGRGNRAPKAWCWRWWTVSKRRS